MTDKPDCTTTKGKKHKASWLDESLEDTDNEISQYYVSSNRNNENQDGFKQCWMIRKDWAKKHTSKM